jgi:iron-regulated transporter 1
MHSARTAGIGLAFLYMTVLGFDNITYGYCLKMCIKESIIGALVNRSVYNYFKVLLFS